MYSLYMYITNILYIYIDIDIDIYIYIELYPCVYVSMRYIWIERHKTTSTHQQLGISWPSSPIDNLPALSTLGCSPGDRTKLRIFQTSQLKQFCSTAKYWVPFGVLKHGWKIDGNPRRKWRVILLLILGITELNGNVPLSCLIPEG